MRQTDSGTIAFYNQNGELLFSRDYRKVKERQDIISAARHHYGELYFELYYHITPDISEKDLKYVLLPEPFEKQRRA